MSQPQQPSTDSYPPLDNPSVDKNVHHQQPPITSYPPVWNHNNNNYPIAPTASNYNPMMNDQQPPTLQNYLPASTTTNAAVGSNFFMVNPANNGLPAYYHNNNNYPIAPTASNYNPMMNDQQQPPVQNYQPASTTTNAAVGSNFHMGNPANNRLPAYNHNNNNYPIAPTVSNYNPMMNDQQQPPVQNYQPASTTANAAVGSNFFMGNPANNGLPAYTKTVAVIGSQYCSPNPFDLIITRKMMHLSSGNFIVEDVNGNLLFKVRDGIQLLRDRRVLLDAEGKPVVTMQKKIMTAHNRWNVFKGDSRESKDLLFCVKETSIIQLRTKLDVFLASNGNEGIGDFRLKGSWGEGSCMIYGGDAKAIIAQMHKKITVGSVLVGKDKFTVTVYPNIDCAFVVALLVILDDINRRLL